MHWPKYNNKNHQDEDISQNNLWNSYNISDNEGGQEIHRSKHHDKYSKDKNTILNNS